MSKSAANNLTRWFLPCVFCMVTLGSFLLATVSVAKSTMRRHSHPAVARAGTSPDTVASTRHRSANRAQRRNPLTALHDKVTMYVKKHFSMRCKKQLAAVDARISFALTGLVRSPQVISGSDGWLFYKSKTDGNSMGDYVGDVRFTDEELSGTLNAIRMLQARLSAADVKLYVLAVPNKEAIYAERMPDKVRRVSAFSRTDEMMEFLARQTDIHAVYPKPALLRAKEVCDVYYPLDTHWNDVGGYVGVQEALLAMGRPNVPIRARTVALTASSHRNDLPRLANLESQILHQGSEWTVKDLPCLGARGVKWNERWTSKNPGARTKDVLLIVGDSFKGTMIRPFSEEFGTVVDVHRKKCQDIFAIVEEVHPNVVLLEFVERYSGTIGKTINKWLAVGDK